MAKQIAAIAYSNTTSVNRVCKKMGYASYTELRYSLPHDLREDSDFSEADTARNKTIEKMTQAMKKVRVVYLYARGGSIVSVSYLSRFFPLPTFHIWSLLIFTSSPWPVKAWFC